MWHLFHQPLNAHIGLPCRAPTDTRQIHGLGGSVAQFAPLLTSLVNVGPCLAIDFPGCGTSAFEPRNCPAYTTESLAMLLATAIERYRDATNGQQVILIGHSMGCSIGALLASSSSPNSSLPNNTVSGFVAICPKAGPRSPKEAHQIDKLRNIPTFVFDLFRLWDRRRGVNSASVSRVVGKSVPVNVPNVILDLHRCPPQRSDAKLHERGAIRITTIFV